MNSNNYVTLGNYTGYIKNIPNNNNIVYNISSISYPKFPNEYQFIVQNDSKENYARINVRKGSMK